MIFGEEVICSRQNRTVVELCKLSDRKAREASRTFRFDGIKLLEEAVKNRLDLKLVALKQSSAERIGEHYFQMCEASNFRGAERVVVLSDELFDKISEEKSPEGVICIAKYIDKFEKNITIYNSADFFKSEKESLVLLESVRDPSNIGAIIRSAAAIGVDRLIVSADCADVYHPRAVRASMGTLFNQPITRVESMPDTVAALREAGRRVYAAALDPSAKPLGSFKPERRDVVVIGNEGHGLTPQTVAACDGCVIIPMTDRAESFNAAVAASILMWEFIGK